MNLLSDLCSAFWSESVWMPPNVTWVMYEKNDYRYFNDIYYSAHTAVALLVIRIILDKTIFVRFGIWLGLDGSKVRSPAPNPVLEKTFRRTGGKLNGEQLSGLSKQTDLTERQVQRWMRQQAAFLRPTTLNKFTESAWRCLFYFAIFTYGIATLWNKECLWDSTYCFRDYPRHQVTNDIWWYYNVESGFYLSLLISQFFDVQRKDFWVMFIHHVISLALLGLSWACNFTRIGALVLVIHDFADIPLELAKMMLYANKQKAADICFVVFALCWIASRITFFPYRIIYYTTFVAMTILPMFRAYYIFNALLVFLQLIQLYWTYFIVKMAVKAWNNNSKLKDSRSDDESEVDSDEAEMDARVESPKTMKDSNDNDCELLINHKNGSTRNRY